MDSTHREDATIVTLWMLSSTFLTLCTVLSDFWKISSDKTEPGSEQGTAVDTVGNVSRFIFLYFQESLTRILNFLETGLVLSDPKLENLLFFSLAER
jgi:hypothetical protein